MLGDQCRSQIKQRLAHGSDPEPHGFIALGGARDHTPRLACVFQNVDERVADLLRTYWLSCSRYHLGTPTNDFGIKHDTTQLLVPLEATPGAASCEYQYVNRRLVALHLTACRHFEEMESLCTRERWH